MAKPEESNAGHENPYAGLASNCPGHTEGLNPFAEGASPGVDRQKSWQEEINLQGTDRGFGRGEGYEPNDAAKGSFPEAFAESLSEA